MYGCEFLGALRMMAVLYATLTWQWYKSMKLLWLIFLMPTYLSAANDYHHYDEKKIQSIYHEWHGIPHQCHRLLESRRKKRNSFFMYFFSASLGRERKWVSTFSFSRSLFTNLCTNSKLGNDWCLFLETGMHACCVLFPIFFFSLSVSVFLIHFTGFGGWLQQILAYI